MTFCERSFDDAMKNIRSNVPTVLLFQFESCSLFQLLLKFWAFNHNMDLLFLLVYWLPWKCTGCWLSGTFILLFLSSKARNVWIVRICRKWRIGRRCRVIVPCIAIASIVIRRRKWVGKVIVAVSHSLLLHWRIIGKHLTLKIWIYYKSIAYCNTNSLPPTHPWNITGPKKWKSFCKTGTWWFNKTQTLYCYIIWINFNLVFLNN